MKISKCLWYIALTHNTMEKFERPFLKYQQKASGAILCLVGLHLLPRMFDFFLFRCKSRMTVESTGFCSARFFFLSRKQVQTACTSKETGSKTFSDKIEMHNGQPLINIYLNENEMNQVHNKRSIHFVFKHLQNS